MILVPVHPVEFDAGESYRPPRGRNPLENSLVCARERPASDHRVPLRDTGLNRYPRIRETRGERPFNQHFELFWGFRVAVIPPTN